MIEYFDKDFLDNQINIGDIVIFETPKYRDFSIGKVITKASKSCQIKYKNHWGSTEVVRQYYGQIIKHPTYGEWIAHGYKWRCSVCKRRLNLDGTPTENGFYFCPNCGAKMDGERRSENENT